MISTNSINSFRAQKFQSLNQSIKIVFTEAAVWKCYAKKLFSKQFQSLHESTRDEDPSPSGDDLRVWSNFSKRYSIELLKASFGIQKLKREYKKMVPTWQVFWHGSGSNYPKNVLSKKFSKKFYKIPQKTSMTKFCFNEFADKQVAQNLCVLILRKQTPTDTKLYFYKGKLHLQLSMSITNLRPMFHFFLFLSISIPPETSKNQLPRGQCNVKFVT